MYTRITRSGPRRYLQLVEGYRDASGRVKQRVVASLGRVDKLSAEDLDPLIQGLQRAVGRPSKPRSPPEYRLAEPESKLGVLRWLEEVAVPELEPETIGYDQLLRAMDALIDHQEAVERAVAGQLRPLLDGELSVVFYDLTTVRISGHGRVSGDVRAFGLSKDSGTIARQFGLGVIQSAEGLPLGFEVFEGNVAETTTLAPMLERLLARFRLERVVVVADRGMLSLDNVETLEALGREKGLAVDYILAVPARRYSEFSTAMVEWHRRLEQQVAGGEDSAVLEVTWQGRRLVIAYDPARALEQAQARRQRIEELTALGDRLAQRLDAQDAGEALRGRRASDRKAYARFQKAVGEAGLSHLLIPDLQAERFCYSVDEQALAAAERLDGKLLLVTSLEAFSPVEVIERYKALADIERGFRVLKSDIEIAPVYHRLPDRIRAHALICFLALVLQRILRQRLKAAGSLLSPERVLRTLCCISDYFTGGFPNYSWVRDVRFPTLITAAVLSGMRG